jgi:hypothetical protein
MHWQLRRSRGSGHCASCRKVAAKSYAFVGSENARTTQNTMLRPTSKDREHAILDIAFMKTGCRKTILRYRGKQSYCPPCGSSYSPPRVKDLRHQLYGKGFHPWVAYLRVALRLSYSQLFRSLFLLLGNRAATPSGSVEWRTRLTLCDEPIP